MKGLGPLVAGIFGTFAFSWAGLALVPSIQIGHLDPQMEEDGTDPYPAPKSGLAERGRHVYVANGCVYCHSQQVRPEYAGSDIARKWGTRRSAPRDYLFDRPVLLGRMRIGPDLANVGKRAPVEDAAAAPVAATTIDAAKTAPVANPPSQVPAPAAAVAASAPAPAAGAPPAPSSSPALAAAASAPATPAVGAAPSPVVGVVAPTAVASGAGSNTAVIGSNGEPLPYSAAWHHRHLYDPRSLNNYSIMPAFRFLYQKRRVTGERSAEALQFNGVGGPEEGWEIVPTYDATALVAYLMSLDQSHALSEVKSTASATAVPAPGKTVK